MLAQFEHTCNKMHKASSIIPEALGTLPAKCLKLAHSKRTVSNSNRAVNIHLAGLLEL